MLLIGSRALMFRAPMALSRKPLDFDFVGTETEAFDWIERNANKIGVDPNDKARVYTTDDGNIKPFRGDNNPYR